MSSYMLKKSAYAKPGALGMSVALPHVQTFWSIYCSSQFLSSLLTE